MENVLQDSNDTQESIDRVPESPPTYSQDSSHDAGLGESENEASKKSATDNAAFSSASTSTRRTNDFVIDIEDYDEEDGGAENDPANSAMAIVDENEFEIEEFPDEDDAILISSADKAEKEKSSDSSDPVPERDPPPKPSDEIVLDPQVKAEDDARRGVVEKYRKFQPMEKIFPDVRSSDYNTVAFKLQSNYSPGDVLEPYPPTLVSKWDPKFVPMPFSDEYVVTVRIPKPESDKEDGNSQDSQPKQEPLRIRMWDRIKETLEQPILCMEDFKYTFKGYCKLPGELTALSYCIEQIMGEEERDIFFSKVVPFMKCLVLQTSNTITCPLPFLRRNVNHNISLSQKQVACLLAHAFFNTFPRRFKSESDMPSINFKVLFCEEDERTMKVKAEKIRCLINYFFRIENEMPSGVVTFSRKNLRHSLMPEWEKIDKKLTKLTPLIQGTIEDDGSGMLKVDFANSYIGGGALGRGAVQEEILFMIYPELILSRLFCEKLNSNEAIIITGCERFSSYRGYSYDFKYDGDYIDTTPYDSRGRRGTQIVGIDALYISRRAFQYSPKPILRELNKAYVGFSSPVTQPVGVATGKWGCGAFNGDPHLKAIIQLMAASNAGRDVAFFTFGDVECMQDILSIYNSIYDMKIKDVWNLLKQYHSLCVTSSKPSRSLKDFCRQYADGQCQSMKIQEEKSQKNASQRFKEVPITRFYPAENRSRTAPDDESVAALISGIDKINSHSTANSEKVHSSGKRQREDGLTEQDIARELMKDEVPKGNSVDKKEEVQLRVEKEDDSTSPKACKRPKRLLDFYEQPTDK